MTVRIQYGQVTSFRHKLADVAPTARQELRKNIREAGSSVVDAVRGAASWSSRIPGATAMHTSFASRGGGVSVRVDSRRAPHARVHNFPNDGANIRHPVFGNRNNWVSTPGHRDWFFKAVRGQERNVVAKVEQAIDKALQGL